jgi:hypothetical protein
VLPEFLERDEAHVARKAERLAGAIEQAHARKPASDHPPLPVADYEIPAIPRSVADRKGEDGFHAWLDDYARQAALGQDVSRRLAHSRHDGTEKP